VATIGAREQPLVEGALASRLGVVMMGWTVGMGIPAGPFGFGPRTYVPARRNSSVRRESEQRNQPVGVEVRDDIGDQVVNHIEKYERERLMLAGRAGARLPERR
jgi:hypothetical protein